ncbi:MAG: hypothetical protein J0H74_17745 [Chitinophagaceae bacterium]|nr:hypothetical protein [Chitinophagaceae bacterium]
MKKWLIGIGIVLVVAVSCVYIFIPSSLVVSQTMLIGCNPYAAFRSMSVDSSREKWWPLHNAGGNVYRIAGRFRQQMRIEIANGDRRDTGQLYVLSQPDVDSAVLQWQCRLSMGSAPFTRVRRYREAMVIRRETGEILSRLRAFLEKKENVYGMKLHITMSKDSALVVTQWKSAVYPGTKDLYSVITKLRSYASSQQARETDPPMLHVRPNGNDGYEIMAAIPVNKRLKGSGDIFPRRFVPWKILVGEVKGGAYTAEQAMTQLRQYVEDHQYPAMALPFQALVTERDKEPDTSRWVTRVIVPVP